MYDAGLLDNMPHHLELVYTHFQVRIMSRPLTAARNRKIRAEIIVFDDVFEVFQTCENLYYASWTHVTSLERL